MSIFVTKLAGKSKELIGRATNRADLEARGKTEQIIADFEQRARKH